MACYIVVSTPTPKDLVCRAADPVDSVVVAPQPPPSLFAAVEKNGYDHPFRAAYSPNRSEPFDWPGAGRSLHATAFWLLLDCGCPQ